MSANLYAALREAFPADPDRVAIATADTPAAQAPLQPPLHYTWRDIDRGSAMIAALFESLDLPRASRIAVQTAKSVEALMLYLAVLRAGHVHVPLNNAYREAELRHFIHDAQPAVVVCAGSDFGWVSKLAFQAGTRHVFTLEADRTGSLLARAAWMNDEHPVRPVSPDDPAAIIYTSGTTGRSKGAVLSHGNLLANAQVLHHHWRWQASDVLIHALPLFHVHGLFVACHGALLAGARTIWFNRFDAAGVRARLPDASVFMGVPTMYGRLLEEPGLTRAACASMRLFISGSAPLRADVFERWRERTGHAILERYGMSETVMLTSNPCDPAEGPRRAGTVGRPLPGVSLRVVDDAQALCATGAIGRIEVRGPSVFSGYWSAVGRSSERTAQDFHPDPPGPPWFVTGDVGFVEADGCVTIVGRSKDLVITGGFNVYPAEVERFIDELPGVAESAVIGVPHPDFGEAVVAVVVPHPHAALQPPALIEALKARMAGFKVPKEMLIAPSLPRNAMGKVQKNELREQHAGLFG
jgi:malonyl-CoA/methylmalonyl-CoA synthetase